MSNSSRGRVGPAATAHAPLTEKSARAPRAPVRASPARPGAGGGAAEFVPVLCANSCAAPPRSAANTIQSPNAVQVAPGLPEPVGPPKEGGRRLASAQARCGATKGHAARRPARRRGAWGASPRCK
eukprot:gnl/Chilomastix_cuspidata/4681.p3 GENE.gnl/Chilomastix_cuspidata/4681~~gnl/Chilomastix_cuspidata/4681.p3  ORF type:complete len:126 (-),score=13.00 gnl/Chilomastix_cuspidata/4681:1150-1527(-)